MTSLLPFLIVLPSACYSLLTAWCGFSFFRRQPEDSGFAPPVTILKPVKGTDPGCYENFASFCSQDYPSPVQIVFAVASAGDPVLGIIAQIKEDFPFRDIAVVVDDTVHGPNYKVCNLINGYSNAKYDIIVVSDSDVRVGPQFLTAVCGSFADRNVGLVTSPYRSSKACNIPAALEALGHTCEMLPNVLVARQLEGLSFALGASMAVRRDALDKIGGFKALVDYLADDYQLGNKIYQNGYRLLLSHYLIESRVDRASLTEILSRQLRWARTMRVSRPSGYLGLALTHPFPAALLALIIATGSGAGISAAILLYITRFLVATLYSRTFVRDNNLPRLLLLLPVRDMVATSIWCLSLLGSRVRWRGHHYRLLSGGKMEEITE